MSSRITKTRKVAKPRLRDAFGEMILRKGCVLYHTSENVFRKNSKKPMLFVSFHPSEWEGFSDNYITRVTLNRDISVFFMVGEIYKSRILPLLDTLTNNPGSNLSKQNDSNLECYTKYLRNERFDGWFSTIEGKNTVEVALLNDDSLFTVSKSEHLRRNWNIGNYANNNTFVPKKWGNLYPICTLLKPVELNINKRYKSHIEAYIQYGKNTFPYEYAFQVILENARIHYKDGSDKFITWQCK